MTGLQQPLEFAQNVNDALPDAFENFKDWVPVSQSWLQGDIGCHLHAVTRFKIGHEDPQQFCAWFERPTVVEQRFLPHDRASVGSRWPDSHALQEHRYGRDYLVFVLVRKLGEFGEGVDIGVVPSFLRLVLLDDIDMSRIDSCEVLPFRRIPGGGVLRGRPRSVSGDLAPVVFDQAANQEIERRSVVLQGIPENKAGVCQVGDLRYHDQIAAGLRLEVHCDINRWPAFSFEQSVQLSLQGFAMRLSSPELGLRRIKDMSHVD